MSWKLGNSNKTIGYLLPFLHQNGKLTCEHFTGSSFPTNLFVNVFNKCEEYLELNQHLFLLYKFNPTPMYQNFQNRLAYLPEYVSYYDPDKYHRMFIFKLEDEYNDALIKFREGKFSKFKKEHKKIILDFYRINEKYVTDPNNYKNPITGTLYKQQWKKEEIESTIINYIGIPKHQWTYLSSEDECSSLPIMEEETYLNIYKLDDKGLGESS